MCSPGDVAIGLLLGDHGYTTRLLVDRLLGDTAGAWVTAPPPRDAFLFPVDTNMSPMLLIVSGSSAGAAAPFPTQTNGVPIMMGEHTDLGSGGNAASIFMYDNTLGSSNDPNQGNTTNKHMKVIDPNHPIMQGIPLDSEGRVKIFRDGYPEENAHIGTGGKLNYEFRWCTHAVAAAAPGTRILGVMSGSTGTDDTNRAALAVCEVGGTLSNSETSMVRLVHYFQNEQGSGGSRRIFTALTDLGRVIFVRAAKWAMGETLTPYQPLNINVSQLSNTSLQIQWTASADKNYKILGSANITTPLFNWQTLAEDIPGVNGTIQKTLDIAAAPQAAYLRVAAVP